MASRDSDTVTVRAACLQDLEAANRVVERALMGWRLPERVKRLALASYLYQPSDLDHVDLLLADKGIRSVGVAAMEAAEPADVPEGRRALSLHGLYVVPEEQGQGIGSLLLDAVSRRAREQGYDGLLVKANREAIGFFAARGLDLLPVEDEARDYPHRFWRPCATP